MRRIRISVLAGLALLVSAGQASADEAYKSCMDTSDGTNTAWGACGSELLQREDGRLNAAWRRLYTGLPEATKAPLLEEQRAWNAYKEKSCAFYANGDWGREGQVLHFPLCRAAVLAARVAELNAYNRFFQQ